MDTRENRVSSNIELKVGKDLRIEADKTEKVVCFEQGYDEITIPVYDWPTIKAEVDRLIKLSGQSRPGKTNRKEQQ